MSTTALITMAKRLNDAKCAYYTGYIVEEPNKNEGQKPKKCFSRSKSVYENKDIEKKGVAWKAIKYNHWTEWNAWNENKINEDHNTLIFITGSKSNNIIVIDWDIEEWNEEQQQFVMNKSVLEEYYKLNNLIWEDSPNTYTEITGNNGVHWFFRYNPEELGGHIQTVEGLKINNIKCLDIRAEGGICYMSPTEYTSINGDIKKYEIENDCDFSEIPMIPKILLEKIPFKIKKFNNNIDSGISSEEEQEIPKQEIINNNNGKLPDITNLDNEYDFIQGYLNCINPDIYQNWLDVSFILGNKKEYIKLYHQWASQSKKYNYEESNKLLQKANGQKTIASLAWMAKKSPKYNELFNKIVIEKEIKIMVETFSDENIAQYYYKHYKDTLYYDTENKIWFGLNNKCIWEQEQTLPIFHSQNIPKFITTKLQNYKLHINKLIIDIDKEIRNYENENTEMTIERSKKIEEMTIKKYTLKGLGFENISKHILKIGGTTTIKHIIERMQTIFTNKIITNIIINQDINRYKFCFENCLFDCKTKQFRDIFPEDYIITTTGYDYNPEPTKINEVNKILNDIMENLEVPEENITNENYLSNLDNLKNIISDALIGYNFKRKFNILSGIGCNGKSLLIENLIKTAFGKYYSSISPSYFTKADAHSNQASPEIADKQYTRFLCLSEPSAEEKFQSSKLKKLTGMDEIQSRQLYQTGKNWKPQFNIYCLCNDIPDLGQIDRATLNRINIINFPNTFETNPNPNNKNERKMISNLPELLINDIQYKQSFIHIIINYFINKSNNDNRISIKNEFNNKDYEKENNCIVDFLENTIIKKKGENIKCSYLYEKYCSYYTSISNREKLTYRGFNKLMKFNKFTQIRLSGNVSYYENIDFKPLED